MGACVSAKQPQKGQRGQRQVKKESKTVSVSKINQIDYHSFYQALKHDLTSRNFGCKGVLRAANIGAKGPFFVGADGQLQRLIEMPNKLRKRFVFENSTILLVINDASQMKEVDRFVKKLDIPKNNTVHLLNTATSPCVRLESFFAKQKPLKLYDKVAAVSYKLPSLILSTSDKSKIYMQTKANYVQNKNSSDFYFGTDLKIKTFVQDPSPEKIRECIKSQQNVLVILTQPSTWFSFCKQFIQSGAEVTGKSVQQMLKYTKSLVRSLKGRLQMGQDKKIKVVPAPAPAMIDNLHRQIANSKVIPPLIKKKILYFMGNQQRPKLTLALWGNYIKTHGKQQASRAYQTSLVLCQKIFDDEANGDKFRRLSMKNQRIEQLFLQSQPGQAVLDAIGFRRKGEFFENQQPDSRLREIKDALMEDFDRSTAK